MRAPPSADGCSMSENNSLHDFGDAIRHIKAGGRAQRVGWNGKDMWIAYGEGRVIPANSFWNTHTRDFATHQPNGHAEVLPYILFKTADDKILMGWLASQSDMLAMDWVLM